MRPVVGVTAKFSSESEIGTMSAHGVAGENWHLLSDGYIRSLTEMGCIPLILPVYEDARLSSEALSLLDGLMLTGGCDIHPSLYGESPIEALGITYAHLDKLEIEAYRAAAERDMPILGICRGIQIMNVARGGSLYQDTAVSCAPGHPCLPDSEKRWTIAHGVNLEEGSRLHALLGKKRLQVNSFHHQSVARLGEGMRATGRSDDGTIEAVETEGASFEIGVQWHPEMLAPSDSVSDPDSRALFNAFAEHCKRFHTERR
jgi:putative glutamine amidotransferase